MNANQYKNVVQNTLNSSDAQTTADSMSAVRAVCNNLGVAFPNGTSTEVQETLNTGEYMGWEPCTEEEAQQRANCGTPVLGMTDETVTMILPEDTEEEMEEDVVSEYAATTSGLSDASRSSMQYYSYSLPTTTTTVPVVDTDNTPVNVNCLYNIVNVETGKVANIDGNYLVDLSNEKNITLYSKSGTNEQVWQIDAIAENNAYYIKSYVDEDYGFNASRSQSNNYNCNIYKILGNEVDAAVEIVLQTDGFYKIRLANYSNYYLTATDSIEGADIRWQPEDNTKNQRWKFEAVDLSQRYAIADRVVGNIENCPEDVIPRNKRDISIKVAEAMLGLGYPVAFVAGMIANIVFEGCIGQFEKISSNDNTPARFAYLDDYYDAPNYYLNNFSGKTIMDVDVTGIYNMFCDIETQTNGTWIIDGTKVGFGLGCIQWTYSRTFDLVKVYREVNENRDSITEDEAGRGEVLLMLRELGSPQYYGIISEWESDLESLESEDAASAAGRILSDEYVCPRGSSAADKRANRAVAIYSAIA